MDGHLKHEPKGAKNVFALFLSVLAETKVLGLQSGWKRLQMIRLLCW